MYLHARLEGLIPQLTTCDSNSSFFLPGIPSFDFGVLHVIIISTEQDVSHSSEQYKFVASDLAAMNRTATPWVIFAGHRPYYIDSTNNDPGSGDQTVAKVLRASFEDLLNKYKVRQIRG